MEFKISKKLKTSNETFLPKNKDLYKDFIKFLKDKFSNIVSNFKNFLSLLENMGGLIIIFSEEKMNDVRNNMIRASNNKICMDIMSKTAIFPILKDSETANELIKVFSVKNYPFYIFCKYENGEKIEIKSSEEKKFWMKDVVETLLSCFPEKDIKKSIYNVLSNTLSNISFVSDEFTGDSQELNTIINNLKTILNNSINTLWDANRDNSNNFINDDNNNKSDGQQKHLFLDVIIDERKMLKKSLFKTKSLIN